MGLFYEEISVGTMVISFAHWKIKLPNANRVIFAWPWKNQNQRRYINQSFQIIGPTFITSTVGYRLRQEPLYVLLGHDAWWLTVAKVCHDMIFLKNIFGDPGADRGAGLSPFSLSPPPPLSFSARPSFPHAQWAALGLRGCRKNRWICWQFAWIATIVGYDEAWVAHHLWKLPIEGLATCDLTVLQLFYCFDKKNVFRHQLCHRPYHWSCAGFGWWCLSFCAYSWGIFYAALYHENRYCWQVKYSTGAWRSITYSRKNCYLNCFKRGFELERELVSVNKVCISNVQRFCTVRS